MKNKMFHYINIRNLSDKAKAVMYIFESNKEFYSLFGKSKYEICLDFTNMINDKRTEEFNSKAIFLNNNIIGAISFYDSDEIYLRQIFSLNYLQNKSPIETNIISSFSNPDSSPTVLTSNILVTPDFCTSTYASNCSLEISVILFIYLIILSDLCRI